MAFQLLTPDEAAKQARISRRTLCRRIADGTGPAAVRMARKVLLRSDAFQAWLEQLPARPIQPAHEAAAA